MSDPRELRVLAFGKTDIGRRRANNQDSLLVNVPLSLYAVADGMGGHSGGEVASALAVKTLEKVFEERRYAKIRERMREAVSLANSVIYDQAQKDSNLNGMGTTLTALAFDSPWLYIAQVGDSRCYLFRDGELFQITEDHSQIYEMLRAGMLNEIEAQNLQKNVITRSVGYEPDVRADIYTRFVQPGDRYLICSDGLSGAVSNEQMAQVLQNFRADLAVQNLVNLANFQGGDDNITVVLLEVE